jgi:uncharacterized membrane protein YgcG
MRLSVGRTPKEVGRKLHLKTGGPAGAMRESAVPGLRTPVKAGMKLKGMKAAKGRGSMLVPPSTIRMAPRARTGISRTGVGSALGMSRARTRHNRLEGIRAIGWIVPASIAARRIASSRMLAARGWTAPRLHRAAVHFNGSIAPKIGSALNGTASWIEPPRRRRASRSTMMGVLAACLMGAAASMMMTRRRHEMEHLLEPVDSLEAERYRREQTLSGSYSPSDGARSSSYGGQSSGGGRSSDSR